MSPEKFADLHLHTVFSDGTYTPERLISEAKRQGLSAISVVDHDTVLAIEPLCQAAETSAIEIIPGIELTSELYGREIHILGYLIDHRDEGLRKKLEGLRDFRIKRIYTILERLKNLGVDLSPADVFEPDKPGTVGRLHIARAMLRKGFVDSIAAAFQKYIGDNCPAYVLGFRLSPAEAIGLIRSYAGVPVLAHPYTFKSEELIPELAGYGLKGLEVYYPEHTQGMINYYLGLANKLGLLVTGGSDCHGDIKEKAKIGKIKIPYALVEKLKEAK